MRSYTNVSEQKQQQAPLNEGESKMFRYDEVQQLRKRFVSIESH